MSGFEFRVLGFKSLRVLLLVGLCVSSSAGAEPTELPADLLQAVQEGRPEVLARFGETSRPEECRLLAQAYANLARRVADATERSQACQRSAEWYERWIAAVDQAAKGDTSPQTLLEQAAARLEYASMVMNLQAAGELDRFEITAGQQGDRAKLLAWLGTARIQCRRAELLIEPVHSALRQREDEFLAAGIYDSIVQTKFDAEFNDAWAGYYCAVLDERNQEARLEALSDAENAFRMLLEAGRAKQARGRCLLGLALAQRELGRLGEAERNFAAALKAESALWRRRESGMSGRAVIWPAANSPRRAPCCGRYWNWRRPSPRRSSRWCSFTSTWLVYGTQTAICWKHGLWKRRLAAPAAIQLCASRPSRRARSRCGNSR
jgi:hypothetical protein